MNFAEDFEQISEQSEGQEGGISTFEDLFESGIIVDGGSGEAASLNDAVIFLVDCHKSMFHKSIDQERQFDLVVEAISSFMKNKIIASKNDKMSVILYNVQTANNPNSFKGINLIFPLENPDAERIKQIMHLSNQMVAYNLLNPKDKQFDKKYGSLDKDQPLFEALWLCTLVFKEVEKKPFTKRIFLFTNEDNPNATDRVQRDQAISYAKRLGEMDVDIELFPLRKADGSKFEVRKFYADLIIIDPEDANQEVLDTSSRITELTKRIRHKIYKKRHLKSLDFHLAPGVKIAIRFYAMIYAATKPFPVSLDRNTNKRLNITYKMICDETGSILNKDQIGYYFPFGDEKVFFKKEEIAEIKKFDDPSLKLVGFKPSSRLKPYQNLKSSYFLYPDEERINGSSQLCDALIKQMIAKDKIAIVRFVPRATSSVRFAALLPQSESFDEDNSQTPPGFNLVFLPFADEIRNLATVKPSSRVELNRDQIVNAKLLIKSLSTEFDCRNFENPNLQTFFANLQAIALGEDEPEEVFDLLEQDTEGMERYKEMVHAFKKCIWEVKDLSQNQSEPEEAKRIENTFKEVDRTDIDNDEEEYKGRGKSLGRDEAIDYDDDSFIIIDDRSKKLKDKIQSRMNMKESNDSVDVECGRENVEKWLRQGEVKASKSMNYLYFCQLLQVKDLKEYLKSKGLPTGGEKDDLLDRALKYFRLEKSE